ncbi:MATE family efflux transporter [Pontibacter oryzae]|uniref:MATE family efflux transporter n=1 Tax=Pontibacter oryzae TaxID=2304593 RepID=A0A399SHI4_9BACT|nr:MATE family efflux transporter [Pontibacter oryzae]RIJ42299.1 MATE family efflux transporter [Pontibacter oryzae]
MNYWLATPYYLVKDLVQKGHVRSIKAKKNILASIVIKGCSVAISLALVPLTINYISPSGYGIWLTLSAIVSWFSFFDIGMTQGLRNKFAEAKAKDDTESAQSYVSTAFAVIAIIFSAAWLLFLAVNQFLDWSQILGVEQSMRGEISMLATIVFTYFCLQFVLRIITTVITADQQPAKASVIDMLGQLLALIIIFVLVYTTSGSLINLGLALCIAPLVVLGVANIYFFRGPYKVFRPSLAKVNLSHAKGLFGLGAVFFVIQLSGIIQYETANLIISRNFGPSEVTSYNIVFRYFGILNMVFAIFLTPFWSASTEAFLNKDMKWIRSSIQKYNWLNMALMLAGTVMLLFSEQVYTLWLGKGTVEIDFMLSFWGFMFFAVSMFGSKYVSLLNGISALRLQFLSCLISPFIYILTVLILIKYYNMGVYSVFIGAIIANFNAFILAPIQYYKIIVQNKRGIWIR